MKSKFLRIFVTLLSCIILFSSVMGCGENKEPTTEQPTVDKNLLFSFESYDDIFRSIKTVYNRIGVYGVSDEHVTEGKKSMKLEVIGKYTKDRPGFDLYCTGSAFLNSNFTNFEKLAIDVYNANDKDLTVGVFFNVNLINDYTKSGNTPIVDYKLKANSSTTIEYEIPNLVGYCDMEKVNYIHFEFAESKVNKEDKANVFYFDNIRGIELETPRTSDNSKEISFTNGLDFESLAQVMIMPTFQGFVSDWKKYEALGIETPEELNLGEYALVCTNPSKATWPGFVIDFGEVFESGTKVSFLTYISCDENDVTKDNKGKSISPKIESYSDTAKTYTFDNSHKSRICQYNEWFEVTITFNTGSSNSLWLFYTMAPDGTENHLISGDYTVVIDNVRVIPAEKNN